MTLLRSRTPSPATAAAWLMTLMGLGGCAARHPSASSPSRPVSIPAPSLAAARLLVVEGLSAPRGAVHDTAADVYFISNGPADPPGRGIAGFISRVRPDGRMVNPRFIEGGRDGAALDSPKGLAISGNLLWVADIDVLRAFDRQSGALVKNVDAAPLDALYFQGVTTGPDGAAYVADAGLRLAKGGGLKHGGLDRVYRVDLEMGPGIAFRGSSLGSPGAIAWDQFHERFLTVPLAGEKIMAWRLSSREPEPVAPAIAPANGVAVLDAKRFLVSSEESSAVYLYENGRGAPLVTGIAPPGGLGLDRRRRRLLIPIPSEDRLEVWQLSETK